MGVSGLNFTIATELHCFQDFNQVGKWIQYRVQMKHLHYIVQACVSRAQVQMGPSSLPPMIEKYKEENNYKRCLFTLRCRLVRTSSGQRTRQKISKIVQQKKVYAFIKRTNIKRNHQRMEHFCRNKKQTLVVY